MQLFVPLQRAGKLGVRGLVNAVAPASSSTSVTSFQTGVFWLILVPPTAFFLITLPVNLLALPWLALMAAL